MTWRLETVNEFTVRIAGYGWHFLLFFKKIGENIVEVGLNGRLEVPT